MFECPMYLNRLANHIRKLDLFVVTIEIRVVIIGLKMAVAEDPNVASEQPASFLVVIDQAAFTASPVLTDDTFEVLR